MLSLNLILAANKWKMGDLKKCLRDFIGYSDSSIAKRGKSLARLLNGVAFDLDETSFSMKVPSSDGHSEYDVWLEYITETEEIEGSCSCPFFYDYENTCKHQVAAALKWASLLEAEQAAVVIDINTAKENINQPKTRSFDFPFTRIEYNTISRFAPGFRMNEGSGMMWHYRTIVEEKPDEKKWIGSFYTNYKVIIKYKDKSHLNITCNCSHLKEKELCQHAVAVLLHISRLSPSYFLRFNDYTNEKKLLLAQFGIAPEDDLAKEFEFGINYDGIIQITKKPEYLLGPEGKTDWSKLQTMLSKKKKTIIINTGAATVKENYETVLLFNFNNSKRGGFALEPVMMWNRKGDRSFKRIPFENEQGLGYLLGLPEQMIKSLQKITDEALLDHLARNGYSYIRNAYQPFNDLNEKQLEVIQDVYYEVLKEIKLFASVFKDFFHLKALEKFANANIRAASLSAFTPQLQFRLFREGEFLKLACEISLNNVQCPLTDFELAHFFLRCRSEYFLLNKEDIPTLEIFSKGMLMTHENNQHHFLEKVVKPLAEKYDIDFGDIAPFETIDAHPQGRVYLSELNENFLLIRPKWLYETVEIEEDETENFVEEKGVFYKIIRKKEEEKTLIEAIRPLYSKFAWQNNGYFYISFKEALQHNWFLNFYTALQHLEIPVYGINELKKFKYNPNKPKFEIKAGSGTDWFDLTITVTYGDLPVPLQELRKAIINKQQYILLGDGSMGMLPQEWIEKYALLMKMAQLKDGQLRVSKFNWTIIDELHHQLNDAALLASLSDKKKRLEKVSLEKANEYRLSKKITATLRTYQQSGFQWLCLLDEMGWGACLADDMGLGKTLQTISFLQYAIEKYPTEQHLVICPTSLIYNWESELQKFAPQLTYHIHYGAARDFETSFMQEANIILTSYGNLRSDIEDFVKKQFGYVILDESHTIKNPASQIAKATQLLKARNRIALSGTPLQNNTFDLYSQMQFLNPGMLGSQEFFKTTFANAIDKYSDKQSTDQLKKIIYPFMLRRTKEQVANDLPDKTEMVLWCEMEKEQRKIYNSFKDHYRQTILEKIEESGVGKSSFFILEGLTKLRQICDSPAILNEEENYPNQSAKLEELVRELEENTGNHKALVFSQFTTMLSLVRQSLKEHGINYCYLDGSTAASERNNLVKQFQEDENLRVLLISLKAGGVGLNLTAADYVYLIDPWWNPAAEQQAIDRTHRIGQQKKVFAYKMICKDTVEEKILQLQQKKKNLSADLISDETGFVKKLTKEDVVWLFG